MMMLLLTVGIALAPMPGQLDSAISGPSGSFTRSAQPGQPASPALVGQASGPDAIGIELHTDVLNYGPSAQVEVQLVLTGNTGEVLGGVFYLSYAKDFLDFVEMQPGDAPFTVEEEESVDELAGEIAYTVGVPVQTPPAGYSGLEPVVLARITFDILQENCDLVDAVAWRDPGFPLQTRLAQLVAGQAQPLYLDVLDPMPAIAIDLTDPVFTDPDDVFLHSEPGTCAATVTWPLPAVIDNCDAAPAVECVPPSGTNLAAGLTTVVCTATDASGNVGTTDFDVTVSDQNQAIVQIDLQATVAPSFTRCLTIEAFSCPDPNPVEVHQEVLFLNGEGVADFLLPCGTYDCFTVEDELHTLRRTLGDGNVGVSAGAFLADFSDAGKTLVGGNLNDDPWIDILDYGVYIWQYNVGSYGTGDTTCLTPYPHADINGDGLVTTADYTFVQINFLQEDDATCCTIMAGAPFQPADSGPLRSVRVSSLPLLGLSELATADLNGDGWLDMTDVQLMAARLDETPRPAGVESD